MSEVFETLRETLLRAGVAPRAAGRYVAELNDHLADLTAAERQAGQDPQMARQAALGRLGSADTLAQAMLNNGAARSWTAKAPAVAYLATPPVAYILAAGLAVALLPGLAQLFPASSDGHALLPPWFAGLAAAIQFFDTMLLPILAGWCLAFAAAERRARLLWPALGLIALAVIGGALELNIVLPAVPGSGSSEISLGFALASPSDDMTGAIAHIAVNLAATLLPFLAWQQFRSTSTTR